MSLTPEIIPFHHLFQIIKKTMKSNFFIPFICLAMLVGACNSSKKQSSGNTTDAPAAMVGNDADEHGCKASTGYTWSVVKNECVRLFESGIRLDPQDPSLDKTLSAFILFKSIDDDAKAEVFIPNQKESRIFKKQPNSGEGDAGTWKDGDMTIKYWKGMYMLENNKNKVLYQGMWDNK